MTAKYPVGLAEGVSPVSLQIAACGVQALNGVFAHNPVWVVWKADSAVGKNKICLLPLGFRGMHEAAITTTAKCRAAESEVPCGCAVINKPARVRLTSLLNDH
jgi:hypothetical protein